MAKLAQPDASALSPAVLGRKLPFALLLISVFSIFPFVSRAQSGKHDACSLIDAAGAQTAIGEPVGPTRAENRSSGSGEGSSCRYRSTTGSALKGKSISLTVHYSQTDLTGSADGIAQSLKSGGFNGVRSIPGIGSAAVWGTNSVLGRPQGELTVIQGRSVMLVILIDGIPDASDALARAKVVAAKAIGKL